MASDEGDGGIDLAMRDRNPGIGQAPDARADARHDSEGDTRRHQRQGLLPPTAEYEGIAALQAQHPPALASELDQPERDVALLRRRLAAALARIFQLDAGPCEIEDAAIDQRVIDDHLGLAQAVERKDREQAGIARPSPGEPHTSRLEGRQVAENLLHAAHSRGWRPLD